MKIGILEPDHFSENAISELKKIGKPELFKSGNIHLFAKNKQVLFVRLKHQIDKNFIDAATNLKIICSPTTGLNHIDTAYCKEKNIKVISLKGETSFLKTIRATPEHTLGLILALKRNYKSAFLNSSNQNWDRDLYRGHEIFGSKIGIIGLGRVGNILSGYLTNMGATVAYYDIKHKRTGSKLKRHKSMSALIKSSDVVVLCSSYDSGTGAIIEEKEINELKGKYFINTARAELTNENYLAKMALQGFFAGIAIDVIQDEQNTQTNLKTWIKAVAKHNVIVTPHIGGATFTSMCRTEEFISDKLSKFIDNQ